MRPMRMIWLKFAANLPKSSTDDLGRFKVNLSQIILVVALHFMFYYVYSDIYVQIQVNICKLQVTVYFSSNRPWTIWPQGAANLEFQIIHGRFGTPNQLLLGADLEISKSAAPKGNFGINQVKLSSDLMQSCQLITPIPFL